MAYSGTVGQTSFNVRRVIDNAVRRCRIPVQQITAETLDTAKDQLYLLLSSTANSKLPLWCVEKTIYPLYEGQPYITTYAGTVDILNANIRQLAQVTGTPTTSSSQIVTQFTTATQVTTVGVHWSAASPPGLEFARSNDGSSWTVIQIEAPTAAAGEWTWYDLDIAVAATYFRIRATSGTISASETFLGNTPSSIPMGRLNRDDYTALPNLSSPGYKPLQYWLDRKAASPVMRLWPVPMASTTYLQVVAWAHRHIMDIGSYSNDVEVPQRWLEAVVAMLAAKLAGSLPDVDPALAGQLDAKADAALRDAQNEERDNSPMTITPNISGYTR